MSDLAERPPDEKTPRKPLLNLAGTITRLVIPEYMHFFEACFYGEDVVANFHIMGHRAVINIAS